ncbi:regulation of nuclear pre-mRNA domain-containing protein 2 isoform X2 [Sigmodon hispidus]
MAAGGGGGSSKASSLSASSVWALESSLDRKFQSVTNTMEYIQGLSSWCIENKKHPSTIVYHWIKWLQRCECGPGWDTGDMDGEWTTGLLCSH